ncbi:MAG: hypothetical protein MJK12_06580 [Colwellia sp.]|nr:hypothetical protein [Colwellia sp.]
MKCPNINKITFSHPSKVAIKEIRRIDGLSSVLMTFIGASTFSTIFLGNNAIESTYSLNSTDFKKMSQAMLAISSIKRELIEKKAGMMLLKTRSREEKLFWNAIFLGCKG